MSLLIEELEVFFNEQYSPDQMRQYGFKEIFKVRPLLNDIRHETMYLLELDRNLELEALHGRK